MTRVYSAVIAAAGRLDAQTAQRFGSDIKALVRIGDKTLLARLVDALRAVSEIGRINVVGPRAVHDSTLAVDEWIEERESGEANVVAALESARGERTVFAAADLPFVTGEAIAGLLRRVADQTACAYPIFTRDEFEAAFPGGRSSFARLADGEWTGGSVLVIDPRLVLRDQALLRRAFAARKNLVALASLLGPKLALLYATKRLRVADVEARLGALAGGTFEAIRGADPALAMDCDEEGDFAYSRAHGRGAPAP
ncbi:MAG: NTP transferase domain-containing protein [Candidatus Eremiobacteraeota bacterium]|nr:NTP transferase domain-containing protein [Candidatus Eremiobacteraeota bacterium]